MLIRGNGKGAKERCYKIVVVGISGAGEFVRRTHELMPAEERGAEPKESNMRPKDPPGTWTLTGTDFAFPGPGTPAIRVFLAGHEGSMLLGMERRLKDRLYKGVDGILCIGEDAQQLERFAPLIKGDLNRLQAQGETPPCLVAAADGHTAYAPPAGMELATEGWRTAPRGLLETLMKKLLETQAGAAK